MSKIKIDNPNLIYYIPNEVVQKTLDFLRIQGRNLGHEGVVLWPGILLEDRCLIEQCLIPQQMTGRLSYRIPDSEVFRIIGEVAVKGSVIPIQVHSHPFEAFHSPTDDERAFVQHTNGVSIVLPDFAEFKDEDFLQRSAIYRLIEADNWEQILPGEVHRRFIIVGD